MSKMSRDSSGKLAGLVPLLLFAVLAVSVLTVLMTGARLYGNLTDRDEQAYVTRTTGQYIRTKLRQAPGDVTVTHFASLPAIAIRETIEGFSFVTWIYCYDGYLRELFAMDGEGLSPDAGEKILEMTDMDVIMADGLVKITLKHEDGREQTCIWSPDGKGESS